MYLHSPLSVINILSIPNSADNYSPIYFVNTSIINRAKSIISFQLSNIFQRASFDALKFSFADN